ncbi:NAD(P)-binding protein [Nitrincola alkalilacustris]|uniref:NAD(P)-binding protein n=1 Tax=Nitrincola alkalilacustris TaxID=1571224 RepID=UPI00197D5C9F|nr:NAD(P)-binding protein [Nitrincola alkalilacustris]
MSDSAQPQKIAILGGGVAAMTAAFYLTETPDWQSKYQIDVYQLGWRLGGKGASGRNPEMGERIEEHGLHIWFGFYANAFRTIQTCYETLDRPPQAPLATWQDAFKPHDFIVLQEWIDQQWQSWPLMFPEVPGNPAHSNEELSIWALLSKLYYWIKQFMQQLQAHPQAAAVDATLSDPAITGAHPAFKQLASYLSKDADLLASRFQTDIKEALDLTGEMLEGLAQGDKAVATQHGSVLHFLLKQLKHWLDDRFDHLLDTHAEIRRLFIMADLGLCIGIGMLEDGVLEQGFDVINDIDFMDWLRKHGANEQYTVNSAPVRGFYDLVFAYVDGDISRPNVEAGTLLRAMMRIALLYKGGVMWKMQAGMGDTIFAPMYEVLKRRGVNFHYFHQVNELVPEGNSIAEIRMTRQVDLRDGLDIYEPLVDVKGLPCWPSVPNYQQINPVQAQLLQDNHINLESFWSDWPEVYQRQFGEPLSTLHLRKGVDFDKVIFGISVGSIPHLCPQLLVQDKGLDKMVGSVKTVVTQAYQIWTDTTLANMGWTNQPDGQQPVLSAFTEPYDTWAPMDQLLCREDWPPALEPKNVSYFCSVQPVSDFPPPSDHAFPARCRAEARDGAVNQLQQDIWNLLPSAASPGEFDWSILIDPLQRKGKARFDAQYWRSNIDPSERYVLSVVNSSQYRLGTNETLFDNLYLTGDWIRTGLNAGCVEAATMAGMHTSRAICGLPAVIVGEKDL